MISVCIATYNGEKYIKAQLNSILSQLSKLDEIIISDDGSTDSTLDIVKSFDDNRIKIFKCERNKLGLNLHQIVASNFENAIINALGDYIFLADQDDVWVDTKVRECLRYLNNYDLVISDAYIMDGYGNIKTKTWFMGVPPFYNYFLKKGKYHGCCMAFSKKMLEVILPFPVNLILHDTWVGLLIELVGKVYFIKEPQIYYRIHGANVSQKNHNSFFFKIRYRAVLLVQIYARWFYYVFKKNRLKLFKG